MITPGEGIQRTSCDHNTESGSISVRVLQQRFGLNTLQGQQGRHGTSMKNTVRDLFIPGFHEEMSLRKLLSNEIELKQEASEYPETFHLLYRKF